MVKRSFMLLTAAITLAIMACTDSGFIGSSGSKEKKADEDEKDEPKDKAETGDADDEDTDSDSDKNDDDNTNDNDSDTSADEPIGLGDDQSTGKKRAEVDFGACVIRPQGGLQHKGKCPANHVLPGTNDGKGVWIHCCPLKGEKILSSKADELFVQRSGFCEADEVVVGMDTPDAPAVLYCSKINTKFLKLSERVPAPFTEVDGATGGAKELLQVYGQVGAEGDACMCPDHGIYVGGRTNNDGECPTDACAFVQEK